MICLFTSLVMLSLTGCSTKAEENTEGKNQESTETPVEPEQKEPEEEAIAGAPVTAFSQFDLPIEGEEIAVITTNMGQMKVRFFPNEAPKAVENFKTHAKEGYYNNLIFHRVIDGFMIQGGDPLGNGTGGDSIWGTAFEDEFSLNLRNFRGALAMANSGENSNRSQFFINQSPVLNEELLRQVADLKAKMGDAVIKQDKRTQEQIIVNQLFSDEALQKYQEVGGNLSLDYVHTVFGQVFEGMEVVDAIAAVETGEDDRPVESVVIEKVEIVPYTK